MPATRTFTYGDTEITVYTDPTNRQREHARQIALAWAGKYHPDTITEFAHVVAYTASVTNGWQPDDSGAGMETWLDLPSELTDKWFLAIATHGRSLDDALDVEKKQT